MSDLEESIMTYKLPESFAMQRVMEANEAYTGMCIWNNCSIIPKVDLMQGKESKTYTSVEARIVLKHFCPSPFDSATAKTLGQMEVALFLQDKKDNKPLYNPTVQNWVFQSDDYRLDEIDENRAILTILDTYKTKSGAAKAVESAGRFANTAAAVVMTKNKRVDGFWEVSGKYAYNLAA
jgi:hypothetical protein